MFEFSVCLRENPHILALLSHYAQLVSDDRTVWQDRVMQMDGIDSKQLTALHGVLIAFNGIEQNTGHAIFRQDGTLSACYRITQSGLREFRRIHGIEVEEISESPEVPQPRVPRKKKKKDELLAVATSE